MKTLHHILVLGAWVTTLGAEYLVLVAMRSYWWGTLPLVMWMIAWRVGVRVKRTEKKL